MPLFSMDDLDHPIVRIPHARDFEICRGRLAQVEYAAIKDELNRRIEGTEVQTSSWMPGSNWEKTPFLPIYEKACRGNIGAAGLFFGQIVWQTFMERPEDWSFGRYEKGGVPIKGITYFQIQRK